MKLRPPALQADSLLPEPPGIPSMLPISYLYLILYIYKIGVSYIILYVTRPPTKEMMAK